MTDETRETIREAWFPLGLTAVGICGLIFKALSVLVPYVYRAVAAAFE